MKRKVKREVRQRLVQQMATIGTGILCVMISGCGISDEVKDEIGTSAPAGLSTQTNVEVPGDEGIHEVQEEVKDEIGVSAPAGQSTQTSVEVPGDEGIHEVQNDGYGIRYEQELLYASVRPKGLAPFVTRYGLTQFRQIGEANPDGLEIVPSPDGSRAVYAYPVEEDSQGNAMMDQKSGLFVGVLDGSAIGVKRRISPTGVNPTWSSDGQRIAYQDNGGVWQGDQGGFGVYVVNADGTGVPQLVGGGYRPQWSPDGTRIMYTSPSGPMSSELVISELRSDVTWTIDTYCDDASDISEGSSFPICPAQPAAWSPDGNWIAYTYGNDIHIISADGTASRRLIRGGSMPIWSPNGQWIAYVLSDSATEISPLNALALWVADVAGNRKEFISAIEWAGDIVWSPDSKRLAYIKSSEDGFGIIWVATLEADSDALAVSPPGSSFPAWSRDSARIAFSSFGDLSLNPEGDAEIFVVDANGSNLVQITDDRYDDYAPQWVVGGSVSLSTSVPDILPNVEKDGD